MADKNYGLTTVADAGEQDGGNSYSDVQRDGTEESKQVFDRYINFSAIINFGFTTQASWQGTGFLLPLILLNGGPAAFVYGVLVVAIGALSVSSSLAEMASMDPHVGAQYRWSAAFSSSHPEFWGLLQGWITVFAWIVSIGPALILLATMIQAVVEFHNASYVPQTWHTTLLMIALIVLAVTCNVYFRCILGILETLGGVCHVLFFIIIVTVLTTLAERSDPAWVFGKVISGVSGWESPGLCWHIGVAPIVLGLVCCDGVTHMIDETKEPRKRVPKTMILAVAMNSILFFSMVIAVLFTVGDVEVIMGSTLPILQVYYLATKSKAASTVLILMQSAGLVVSILNSVASVSRLTWAFARDRGLPYHEFFSKVHPKLKIPIPALGLVTAILCLLSLLNLGSSVAFGAIISLPGLGLCISYVIPITLLTIRKLKGEHPRYGPFKLGRWGLPINCFAICFLIWCLWFIPFPSYYPVTSDNMNYAGPITLSVIALCLLDWFTTGKKRFRVPTQDFNNIELYDAQEKDRSSNKE